MYIRIHRLRLYSGNETGKGDIPFIEADTDNQLAIVAAVAKMKK
jgi:hypothetical protein